MLILPENQRFRRKLLISMSAVLIILHALYIPLMLLYSHTAGDFKMEALSTLLKILLPVISILHKGALYGILLTIFDNYDLKMLLPFSAAAAISLIITRAGELLVYAYTNVNLRYEEVKAYIWALIVSFAADIAIILILFVLSRMSKPKKISRFFLLALTVCAIPMAVALVQEGFLCKMAVESIMAETDYGAAPFSAKEIFSLIWGFLKHIVTALSTLILIMMVNRLILRRTKRRPKNEKN